MKHFAVLVFLAGLAFPVFAQNNAITQRFSALSDSMGATITKSSANLDEFNSQINDNGDIRVYVTYARKHDMFATSLKESENKLNLLLRTNDRNDRVVAERDNYDGLIKQLQSIKTEFDAYIKSR